METKAILQLVEENRSEFRTTLIEEMNLLRRFKLEEEINENQ